MSGNKALLREAVKLKAAKVIRPIEIEADRPVLVILAAGRGTRFGAAPKCVQPVDGLPLARHTIEAFRSACGGPVACVVGYRGQEVMAALGADLAYVQSDNPVGGTAWAAYEALSLPGLLEKNPLVVISMGDRIVTPGIFRKLLETHRSGGREADLTFLTALYQAPRQAGKGRIVRDSAGRALRILEQKDIDALQDGPERRRLDGSPEGNCPLYAARAALVHARLGGLRSDNRQGQYYLTDLVEAMAGGELRTVTTTVDDADYDLLCSDVTRPADLALLEGILQSRRRANGGTAAAAADEAARAAELIRAGRPAGQTASIARQLAELAAFNEKEKLGFKADSPVGLGVSGGRMRIAFMHPDMVRFYGPAWQMPIGAPDENGDQQLVLAAQESGDKQLHLHPTDPKYRELLEALPADEQDMYPGEQVADWHSYEAFGTRMSERLLLSLGYFSEEELARRREHGLPLPPPALWAANNMRRPFSLVGNALASLRTLREGTLGAKVQARLGRDAFNGLRITATGGIPQGGFSSSSALTLAAKNAINALYGLEIPPDTLVHLACQAEYGTGVRAGSLDQATEQKGRHGQGALISSNPRENYRLLGAYEAPTRRIRIIFPYSVARDREAWRWSWGMYAEKAGAGPLTAGEMRKLTGKAAELAAILVRLPFDTDFFQLIEADLLAAGELSPERRAWVAGVLRSLPLLAGRDELRRAAEANRAWLIEQLIEAERLPARAASEKADSILAGLFSGWRDPLLRRGLAEGGMVEERGVPLRAIVAYLFGEVVKNFRLLRGPGEWIDTVQSSQRGDRCVEIDTERLPVQLERETAWEKDSSGPERLDIWLAEIGAEPFDYNQGLADGDLAEGAQADPGRFAGSNFFRGLALIDLAEAMLIRKFGRANIAVRINAAGQGDFFQVHVDTDAVELEEVKVFLRAAFYKRFGLAPEPDIVEVHPGGGAVGVRLSRFDLIPRVVEGLRKL